MGQPQFLIPKFTVLLFSNHLDWSSICLSSSYCHLRWKQTLQRWCQAACEVLFLATLGRGAECAALPSVSWEPSFSTTLDGYLVTSYHHCQFTWMLQWSLSVTAIVRRPGYSLKDCCYQVAFIMISFTAAARRIWPEKQRDQYRSRQSYWRQGEQQRLFNDAATDHLISSTDACPTVLVFVPQCLLDCSADATMADSNSS